ncbi:hypothetical protein [Pseudomonas fluorescens]|uniref:hypothetical protein n=1 Tax=Pseudomonas fluorescens TaxID=294 RepID=UPI000A8A1E7D|nr:hypothetical protein [Pseudomonas fluorescens]
MNIVLVALLGAFAALAAFNNSPPAPQISTSSNTYQASASPSPATPPSMGFRYARPDGGEAGLATTQLLHRLHQPLGPVQRLRQVLGNTPGCRQLLTIADTVGFYFQAPRRATVQ